MNVNYLLKNIILSEFDVSVLAAKLVYWFEKWPGTTTDTDTAKQHTRACTRWVTLGFLFFHSTINLFCLIFHLTPSKINDPERRPFSCECSRHFFQVGTFEDRWILGSTLFYFIKIFNFHLSLKKLRLSCYLN